MRNQVAPSKRSAVARAGPAGRAAGERMAGDEPSVVDAGGERPASSSRHRSRSRRRDAAASTSRVVAVSAPTGTATTTSSAPATASASEPAAASRAFAPDASPSVASSASQPVTRRTPARFAARATEVPSRPVPTIASEATAGAAGGRAAEVGPGLPAEPPASSRRAPPRTSTGRRARTKALHLQR